MGVARVLLIVIGAVLSILGTYVFGLFSAIGYPASGIGFFMNTIVGGNALFIFLFGSAPSFISDPALYAGFAGIEVWLFWILLIVFLIFCIAGILQLVGLKSRIVGVIFSLFPIGVGVMFLLLFYTDILGVISGSFGLFFIGESIGGFLPIIVDIGDGIGLGAFFLLGGGTLGLVGSILPRE